MNKAKLRRPFFVVNPKSYLYGEAELKLAKVADELAKKYDIDILFTAQHADLRLVAENTTNLIITAQHVDGHSIGRGMGKILPEAIVEAGAQATFLNHAENPLTISQLVKAMQRCRELGMLTIVCSDNDEDTKAIATLKPDVMVCEQTSLIGTGKAADASYMKTTTELVKSISPNTLVLQAAGISTPDDVYNAITAGADGTGGTSGIVCADDPILTLTKMMETMYKLKQEIAK